MGLIWLILTAVLSWVTMALARWLAREPGVDNSALIFSWKDLFRLRLSLSRASSRWTKAIPVLAPLVLMGYWCLFWRDDLPGWLYVSQKELYLPVWAGISLLTMLPLLKKGRRGMLPSRFGCWPWWI